VSNHKVGYFVGSLSTSGAATKMSAAHIEP
jgi:hypothetical protein